MPNPYFLTLELLVLALFGLCVRHAWRGGPHVVWQLLAGVIFGVILGRSFRVRIDTEHPDTLITTGVFGFSRNPIYVAFAAVLLGQFLIFTNWLFLVYLIVAVPLFHRQVLREEAFFKRRYGEEYAAYCNRVRRYL